MRFEAYSHTADEVLTELGVDPQQGLSGAEVERRRGIHGWNRLAVVRRRSAWQVFLAQFASLVVGLLGVAAVVALLTGGWIEALAIVVVLLINAVIGFLMEWQAGQALEALRRQTRSMARVRRAGREEELDSAELVPGDVVILHPGDLVPADLRLVEAASLRVEESALTGESEPVAKTVERVARGALLAERYSMIFHGTSIAAGRAVGIVTETGVTTELGRIGTLVAETPDEMTPLRRKLDALGRQLVILVLGIGLTVVIAGLWRGSAADARDWDQPCGGSRAGGAAGGNDTDPRFGSAADGPIKCDRASSASSRDARERNGHLHRQDRNTDREPDGCP